MFWDDSELLLKKRATLAVPPPIPETGWRPPQYFPNLSDAKVIGLDCETKENDWERGPGWARGKGHIVGASLSAVDRRGNRGSWYFPVRHEVEPEYNLDPRVVFPYLKQTLETPHIPKVGANLLYDCGWLSEENIDVQGELHDVQFAEALLDDRGETSLDYLGGKYLGEGKETSALYQWLAQAYGGNATGFQRANIYRSPPRLAGPYAEGDADLPVRIIEKQWPLLEAENLLHVYRLECDLIPLLVRMRRAGVQVNVPGAIQLHEELGHDLVRLYDRVESEYGYRIESTSSGNIGRLLDVIGIPYPKTEASKPSIRKEWLTLLDHPVGELLNEIREHEKIRDTFLSAYILDKNINGKIFPQFHPLRGDEGGTQVGRFSSSDPNFQNIPGRTELGVRFRKLVIADYGHSHWRKNDYSQIHYRILAHNAVGPGSEELRESYRNDPKMDYHANVQGNIKRITGKLIERRPIKNINFGLMYGQQEKSLAYKAGFTAQESKDIFQVYHEGAPYVLPTMQAIEQEAQTFGYTTSLLGRRVRFNMWEPIERDWSRPSRPLPYALAIREYGSQIKRSFGYRAVNYKFQSSEPDIMKTGLRDLLRSGVFDYVGVPRILVHDETGHSVPERSPQMDEAMRFVVHTMENAIQLRVPVFVDSKEGESWGSIE